MKTIKIGSPKILKGLNRVNISYEIIASDVQGKVKSKTLWFSISEKYRDYISCEVCDGVVLVLLHYALRGGYDIESEIPMSEKLHYTLTYHFIPQIIIMNPMAHAVELRMPTVCHNWHPNGVATAMSCGIDSLTTYYEYTSKNIPENYQLTHLTFYEQGAHHGGGGHALEEQDRIYSEQLNKIEKFCQQIGKELIDVRSNLEDFLNNLLWHEEYENTHTYKNIGISMLFQKLIKTYYYADAYNVDQFSCSLASDSAHYEKWMLPNCSTENISFFSANSALTRIEKIKFLSTKPETYNNILVCYKEGENCGKCIKCWRTMLEMEACGVLDLYKGCFDVDSFREQENNYITEMISRKHNEPLMKHIYEQMISQNVNIPIRCIIRGNIRRLHRLLL